MIFGTNFGAAGGGPIKTIQMSLAKMGVPLRPTGVLDQATVDAINGVFSGWDDVPPKLRTGQLTKHDVAVQIGAVSKYVKLAAHGAMSVNAEHY
jgi:hypothetical protein